MRLVLRFILPPWAASVPTLLDSERPTRYPFPTPT